MSESFSWSHTISQLLAGSSLAEDETAAAMTEIMEGAATPAQIAGFVVALRAKGETTDEIWTLPHNLVRLRVLNDRSSHLPNSTSPM